MASLNKVILVGRLTRDPETRYTSGGLALCKFSVAVDRRSKNQSGEKVTDFFYCTAFRQTAEYVQQWLGKGSLVAVEGRIEIDNVEQQDGSKRTYVNITCDSVQGLDSPRDSGGDNYSGDSQGGGYNSPQGNSQAGQQSGGSSQGGGYSGGDDYNQNQPPAQAARPAAAPRPSAPSNNAPAPSGNAPSGNAPAAQRPAPAPAYPEDDYDDADPFADE